MEHLDQKYTFPISPSWEDYSAGPWATKIKKKGSATGANTCGMEGTCETMGCSWIDLFLATAQRVWGASSGGSGPPSASALTATESILVHETGGGGGMTLLWTLPMSFGVIFMCGCAYHEPGGAGGPSCPSECAGRYFRVYALVPLLGQGIFHCRGGGGAYRIVGGQA